LKEELKNGNIKVLKTLKEVFVESLKLLHPFMPFITEALWGVFHQKKGSILQS
jgi:valyl-tRNA synthetase